MPQTSPKSVVILTQEDGEILKKLHKRGSGGGGSKVNLPSRGGGQAFDSFWIQIGTSTQDGSNKRWKYDWIEVFKSTAGYGGWDEVESGRSGHGDDFDYAYNGVEDLNGASGTFGNGVDSANLSGTFDLKPVPDGVIVRGFLVYPDDSNSDGYPCKPELWFWYENGVDGDCAE